MMIRNVLKCFATRSRKKSVFVIEKIHFITTKYRVTIVSADSDRENHKKSQPAPEFPVRRKSQPQSRSFLV